MPDDDFIYNIPTEDGGWRLPSYRDQSEPNYNPPAGWMALPGTPEMYLPEELRQYARQVFDPDYGQQWILPLEWWNHFERQGAAGNPAYAPYFKRATRGGLSNLLRGAPLVASAFFLGGAAFGAFDAIAVGAVPAEAGTLTAVGQAAPLAASEFSLAGTGSGVGIGGQTYGLGLSAEAAGVGLQVPAGSAALLAPALSNPLLYAPSAGIAAADLATAKIVKDTVQQVLSIGRAVRALLGGDAPAAAGPRAVTVAGRESFASDAVWTFGTLAAAVAVVFGLSKL